MREYDCLCFESVLIYREYAEKPLTYLVIPYSRSQAAVSFDQTVMESLLAGQTQGAFDQAQFVYEDGGNSKSFAILSIPGGLPRDVLAGTKLTARRQDGAVDVVGAAADNYSAGDLTLEFSYPISSDQEDHLECRVGGLPENEIMERGCK